MAGYTRQSSFSDGDTITAALFNNEYNQLVNAFNNSTGHSHDGTAASGPVIGLIGDAGETSPNNKVLIDTTNNHIEFYVEVSSSSVQQLRIQDGAIVPITDNDIDLGTSSLEFKDLYIDGTAHVDAINFNGTAITATAAELNILDGVTSTAAELNILDGVTATAAEINTLDGITSTVAELNILDGVTASATDINLIDGITNGTVIASKAIITDANKDISGGRNITITGELDAATLDISGNADIDGTLETDALSINGTTVTSTAAELNILDGVTSTAAELNLLDGVTSTTAELNILDGVTSTAAELNILDGVTSTATELNLLDGVTATTTELNYVDVATAGTVEASKAIVVDSNKDFTGARNITITGELDAATLDVSGDVDIDGTLEADAITVNGTTLAETISDTVGAMVGSNTETGITVSYDDSDNTLDFVLATAQPTVTSLGTLTTLTVDDITINGSTISDAGDLTVDVGGDIYLDADGGDIFFNDNGTNTIRFNNTDGTLNLKTNTGDADIRFEGVDGSSNITALVLDMSDAGKAIFNAGATFGSNIDVTGTVDMDGFTSVGNGTITGDLLIQESSGFPRITLKDSDGTNTQSFINHSGSDLTLTAQNGTSNGRIIFARFDNTTTSTSGAFDTSGNFGVGLSNPSEKIHAFGSGATISAKVETDDGNQASLDLKNSEGEFRLICDGGELSIFDSTDATERFRIDTSGNVGIGTNNPDSTLHIEGGGVDSLRFGNIGASSNAALRISRDDTSIGTGNPLGFLEFGGKDTTSNTDTAHAYISAVASGTHSAGDNPTDLTFGTTPDGSSTIAEVMRIDSSGNVGIGTDSPNANLHVGDSNAEGDATNPAIQIGGTSTYRMGLYTSSEGAVIENKNGDDGIQFRVKTTGEAMRINGGDGKVIIGDTASHTDDLLQIETPASGGGKGIQIRRNDSNGDQGIGRIMFGNNTDTDLATISSVTDGQADCARLVFSTQPTSGASTERIRITSKGNLQLALGSPLQATADGRATSVSVGESFVTILDFSTIGGTNAGRGFYLVTVVREGASVGTSITLQVGVSTNGLVVIYDTIQANGLSAQASNAQIQVKHLSAGSVICHATAIPMSITGTD